ncbi:MAG: hypothetical protein H6668_17380 [Ardenticatenaceae bacterium]|nr:hypothetical protein [Ardenticatenaceae bacterium]
MEQKRGRTGFQISRLGAGLSESGYRLTLTEEQTAASVLSARRDGSINFSTRHQCLLFTTLARSLLAAPWHTRNDYVHNGKCGHAAGDWTGDWTAATVTSIDRSLRLRTDILDLVQLHSCGLDILKQGRGSDYRLPAGTGRRWQSALY